jgi:hypothetical protein
MTAAPKAAEHRQAVVDLQHLLQVVLAEDVVVDDEQDERRRGIGDAPQPRVRQAEPVLPHHAALGMPGDEIGRDGSRAGVVDDQELPGRQFQGLSAQAVHRAGEIVRTGIVRADDDGKPVRENRPIDSHEP